MKRVIVFVSTLLVVMFIIAGCSGGSTKTSVSTTINATMSSLTSSTVASTSPAATPSSNIQWPSAMPAAVPIFTYGTITGSNNNVNGTVQVTFDNVTDAGAPGKYASDLVNAGWGIYLNNGVKVEASLSQSGGTLSGLEVIFANNGATIIYNASTPPWQWSAS